MSTQQTSATIHRHLGELGVMAAQTERAERAILKRAEEMLADVETRIADGRAVALADDKAGQQYQSDIMERGRLHRVIEQAKKVLGDKPD